MKQMSKKMEFFLKLSVVTAWIFGILAFITGFIPTERCQTVSKIFIIFFIISGIPLIIAPFIMSKKNIVIKMKPTKAEIFPLNKLSFNDVQKSFEEILLKEKYKQTELETENYKKIVKFSKTKDYITQMVFLTHIEQIDNDLYDEFGKLICDEMNKALNHKSIMSSCEVIEIICVNKTSETFKQMLNSNIAQHYVYCHLPVGILFDDNTLHIATQKDAPYTSVYKRMRKDVLKVLNIDVKSRINNEEK